MDLASLFESTDQDLIKYDFCSWAPQIENITLSETVGQLIIKIFQILFNQNIESETVLSLDEIKQIVKEHYTEELEALLKKITKLIQLNFPDGAFIKMHRSPKDADWSAFYDSEHFRCFTGEDVLLLLVKSERIAEDIEDYLEKGYPLRLYFQPFVQVDPNNEYRVFIHQSKIVAISQNEFSKPSPFSQSQIIEIAELALKETPAYPNFTMDLEILTNGSYRLFEINPFDQTTDLYLFTPEEIIEKQIMVKFCHD